MRIASKNSNVLGAKQRLTGVEERLEDHNQRISFLEDVVGMILADVLGKGTMDGMTRAKLLSRFALLTGAKESNEDVST